MTYWTTIASDVISQIAYTGVEETRKRWVAHALTAKLLVAGKWMCFLWDFNVLAFSSRYIQDQTVSYVRRVYDVGATYPAQFPTESTGLLGPQVQWLIFAALVEFPKVGPGLLVHDGKEASDGLLHHRTEIIALVSSGMPWGAVRLTFD